MEANTWTNEYGDYIYEHFAPQELIGLGLGDSCFEAWHKGKPKQGKTLATLKSAKVFLNKIRKAKKWNASRQ